MSKAKPIFYSALLLTGVNLLLRFFGTGFQVYLSSRIGAEGIGLLQLVLSIGSMAMVAGMAGIRTATMYLTAEEIGKGHPENTGRILSGCLLYSILISGILSAAVYLAAPFFAEHWIGQSQTMPSIRLLALFLPANCLTGVMVGYFTGANHIRTLALVEVAEQLCSMLATLILLKFYAGHDAGRCCQAVVLGSGLGACVTLICLTWLRIRQRQRSGSRIPIARRLANIALPLALADNLKTGINTVENLMVPRRLALYKHIPSPLAAFGVVSGMVFPVLMFPACILYGLSELLIPELARCAAAGSQLRVRYLTRRSLKIAALYGTLFGGLIFLLAQPLCQVLYSHAEAGSQLRLYASLAPMLYCDAITDAMTKGLGQQKTCVRYNILTSALDVLFLYLLLPRYGMTGYFISFFITHLLNFILSLRLLLKTARVRLPLHIPLLTVASSIFAASTASILPSPWLQAAAYIVIFSCCLQLLGIVGKADLIWFKGLLRGK